MRLCLAFSTMVLVIGVPAAKAGIVTFDFDSLTPWHEDNEDIAHYMTSVYGSLVNTHGGAAGIDLGFGCDPYVFADFCVGGRFVVSFEETPIRCARFAGHVFYPTGPVDFHFRAYSDGVLVNRFTRDNS